MKKSSGSNTAASKTNGRGRRRKQRVAEQASKSKQSRIAKLMRFFSSAAYQRR